MAQRPQAREQLDDRCAATPYLTIAAARWPFAGSSDGEKPLTDRADQRVVDDEERRHADEQHARRRAAARAGGSATSRATIATQRRHRRRARSARRDARGRPWPRARLGRCTTATRDREPRVVGGRGGCAAAVVEREHLDQRAAEAVTGRRASRAARRRSARCRSSCASSAVRARLDAGAGDDQRHRRAPRARRRRGRRGRCGRDRRR